MLNTMEEWNRVYANVIEAYGKLRRETGAEGVLLDITTKLRITDE